MVEKRTDSGFTMVELITALVILALFLTLFFQLFLSAESQRLAVTRRAAAYDIAQTNLRKYQTQNAIPSGVSCDDTNQTNTNVDNLLYNPNATGIEMTNYTAEPIVAPLSSSTTSQHVYAIWPRGCGVTMPAEINSTVTFQGVTGPETVSRAAYVN